MFHFGKVREMKLPDAGRPAAGRRPGPRGPAAAADVDHQPVAGPRLSHSVRMIAWAPRQAS
jgi:hypothetical protein